MAVIPNVRNLGIAKVLVSVPVKLLVRVKSAGTMAAVEVVALVPKVLSAVIRGNVKRPVCQIVTARLVARMVVMASAPVLLTPPAIRKNSAYASLIVRRNGSVVAMVAQVLVVIAVRVIHAMMHMCVSVRILALETRTAMRMLIAQVKTITVQFAAAIWSA